MVERAIPWAVSERESVELEAAPYRQLTPEGRLIRLAAACRAAMRLLRARDDRALVLGHVDPLPESTLRALERLRGRAQGRSQASPPAER